MVPTILRSEMKLIIHQGHFGLQNLKKRAHQSLLWPLINNEIEEMIKNCPTCFTFCNWHHSKPAIKLPLPQEPWTDIVTDLFWLYGHYHLLVVNYKSKFVAFESLKNLLSLTISVSRYFGSMVFLRNYLLTTDLSLPVTILRSFQRVWILTIIQSVFVIASPTG